MIHFLTALSYLHSDGSLEACIQLLIISAVITLESRCVLTKVMFPVVKWELKMFSPFSNQAVFFGEDLTAADTIVPGSERPK